jgi:hypothetical protein
MLNWLLHPGQPRRVPNGHLSVPAKLQSFALNREFPSRRPSRAALDRGSFSHLAERFERYPDLWTETNRGILERAHQPVGKAADQENVQPSLA